MGDHCLPQNGAKSLWKYTSARLPAWERKCYSDLLSVNAFFARVIQNKCLVCIYMSLTYRAVQWCWILCSYCSHCIYGLLSSYCDICRSPKHWYCVTFGVQYHSSKQVHISPYILGKHFIICLVIGLLFKRSTKIDHRFLLPVLRRSETVD